MAKKIKATWEDGHQCFGELKQIILNGPETGEIIIKFDHDPDTEFQFQPSREQLGDWEEVNNLFTFVHLEYYHETIV